MYSKYTCCIMKDVTCISYYYLYYCIERGCMYVVLDYLNIFHVLDRVVYLFACLPTLYLPCPALSWIALSVLYIFFFSCLVLSCLWPCLVLHCLVLSWIGVVLRVALSCLALPCLALPCLVSN